MGAGARPGWEATHRGIGGDSAHYRAPATRQRGVGMAPPAGRDLCSTVPTRGRGGSSSRAAPAAPGWDSAAPCGVSGRPGAPVTQLLFRAQARAILGSVCLAMGWGPQLCPLPPGPDPGSTWIELKPGPGGAEKGEG